MAVELLDVWVWACASWSSSFSRVPRRRNRRTRSLVRAIAINATKPIGASTRRKRVARYGCKWASKCAVLSLSWCHVSRCVSVWMMEGPSRNKAVTASEPTSPMLPCATMTIMTLLMAAQSYLGFIYVHSTHLRNRQRSVRQGGQKIVKNPFVRRQCSALADPPIQGAESATLVLQHQTLDALPMRRVLKDGLCVSAGERRTATGPLDRVTEFQDGVEHRLEAELDGGRITYRSDSPRSGVDILLVELDQGMDVLGL
mmetsp:Transcript_13649/g.39450  ORF Transcript_13649/g.39450 Transcript_13649/m.39450 type:complete len:257 (+) Transcript_13649:1193-1963(+)